MMTIAGTSVNFSLTASSQSSAITRPTAENVGLHVANIGADYCTIQFGSGSATATLKAGATVPPNGQIVVDWPKLADYLAVIGATTGNIVVATPVIYR